MICKDSCRQAIADWCKIRRSYLDSQFISPLKDIEFNNALNPKNWFLSSETTHPDDLEIDGFKIVGGICEDLDYDSAYKAWMFDCEPFDDQLRTYVKVNNKKVVSVLVQGE